MTWSFRCVAGGVLVSLLAGCGATQPIKPPVSEYAERGAKTVPDFLKGTVFQYTDLANISPLRVSGYGLVVNLDGTGDTRTSGKIREYIFKQMQKHGFGSTLTGLHTFTPDQVLNDPQKRTAIVRVDGYIPPGAHEGQLFDAQVSALENSNTSSLHHGTLYETDLAPRGADPMDPGGGVINPMARVMAGQIVINPVYALGDDEPNRNQKLSMKYGRVMNKGVIAEERPLVLKLRQPERRLARQIEGRINELFQDASNERFNGSKTAVAKDEGEIWLYVPKKFGADWERFANVVLHCYFNGNADFAQLQAKKLADLARTDGLQAPLLDMTYCWEALGEPATNAVASLYASPVPEVSFAAARAGAFLGDPGAVETLIRIGQTVNHPFQITAVQVLGAMPPTAQLRSALRTLLDSNQLLVRLAAYDAMVATDDPILLRTPLKNGFALDMIETDGPPIIYATRTGPPRIALIGRRTRMVAPNLLSAMKNRLTVMADADRRGVDIFYRPANGAASVHTDCMPDLGVLIARLGGEAPDPTERLPFQYGDVIGLVQRLTEKGMVKSADTADQQLTAVFQMQALPGVDDPVLAAPSIPEQRPTDVPTTQPLTDSRLSTP